MQTHSCAYQEELEEEEGEEGLTKQLSQGLTLIFSEEVRMREVRWLTYILTETPPPRQWVEPTLEMGVAKKSQ